MRSAVALLLIAAIAGCSALPTAPLPSGSTSPLGVKSTVAPAPGGVIAGDDLDGGGQLPPPPPPPAPVLIDTAGAYLVVTYVVYPNWDATIDCGPFSLDVPRGAVDSTATIAVVVKDSVAMLVSLHIFGVKNQFNVPITLSADVSHFSDPRTLGVLWRNDATGNWEEIPSWLDARNNTIHAPLEHFSEYTVQEVLKSKAGW